MLLTRRTRAAPVAAGDNAALLAARRAPDGGEGAAPPLAPVEGEAPLSAPHTLTLLSRGGARAIDRNDNHTPLLSTARRSDVAVGTKLRRRASCGPLSSRRARPLVPVWSYDRRVCGTVVRRVMEWRWKADLVEPERELIGGPLREARQRHRVALDRHDLHHEDERRRRRDLGRLAARAVRQLVRDVHLPLRARGGGGFVRVCVRSPPRSTGEKTRARRRRVVSPRARSPHLWRTLVADATAHTVSTSLAAHHLANMAVSKSEHTLSPTTMSCIASVQPLMTWFGAKVLGRPREYDESNSEPSSSRPA